MERKSTSVAIALLVLAAWTLVDSARYGIGSFVAPGPGLFPFLLAGVLCVVSVVLLIHQRTRPGGDDGSDGSSIATDRRGVNTFWQVAAILFAYALLLESLGFALSSFICMSALFKAGNSWRWAAASVAAASLVAIAYALFVVVLNVPLPRGYWA
jgi:putative tricarboxylic transport membrane protein